MGRQTSSEWAGVRVERWIDCTTPESRRLLDPVELSNCRARQEKSDRNRTLEEARCDWANVFVGNSGGAMAYGAKISGVDRGMRQP
ncbi:hypothetical protein [Xanthomonas campestris]|uniref:hypothetical protein n=1 Tax=Xanthomonas campestris TaxID=339 RepID=UPI00388F33B5